MRKRHIPARISLPGAAGFTLLELCIVLVVVTLLFAVGMPYTARLMREDEFEQPIRELQDFAKEARIRAMTEGRPYEVWLLNDRYVLRVWQKENGFGDEVRSYALPPGITYAIKRDSEEDFSPETEARWAFMPNGLCEPLTFLFQKGKDWNKFRVDPLTARFESQKSFLGAE
jgi:type II secretory pathway pseudopilin PulG